MLRQTFIHCTICLLLVGCSSQGNKAPVATLNPSDKVSSQIHQVAKHETLHGIATKYGKDVKTLAALNSLHEPYQLQPGQKLVMGTKSNGGYKSSKTKLASASKSSAPQSSDMGFVKVTPEKPVFNDLPTDGDFKPSKQQLMAEVNKSEFSQYEVAEAAEAVQPVLPAPSAAPAPTPAPAPKVVTAAKMPETKPKVAALTEKAPAVAVPAVAPVTPAVAKSDKTDKPLDKGGEKVAVKVAEKEPEKIAEKKVERVVAPSLATKSLKGWRWPHGGSLVLEGNQYFNRNGIDIKGNPGDTIKSVAEGKVVYKGNGLRGYGELVIIKHPGDFLTAYAHNEKVLVKEGDVVKAGDTIAYMGNTGSDSVKLHFEMRHKGKPVDPTQYLPAR